MTIPKFFKDYVGTVEQFKIALAKASESKRKEINRSIVFIHEKSESEEDEPAGLAIYANGHYYITKSIDEDMDVTTDEECLVFTESNLKTIGFE